MLRQTFAVVLCLFAGSISFARSEEFKDDAELVAKHRQLTDGWRVGHPPDQMERAIEHHSKVLEKQPQNWTALRLRTFCYMHLERHAEVERDLPVLQEKTPKHPWVWILAGQYYSLAKGEIERPIKMYLQALPLLPEKTEKDKLMKASIQQNLADLLRQQGTALQETDRKQAQATFASALRHLEQAEAMNPRDPHIAYERAWLHLQSREYAKCVAAASPAITLLEKLVQNDPVFEATYSGLLSIRAEALLQLGKYDEARLDVEKGFALAKKVGTGGDPLWKNLMEKLKHPPKK